MDEQSPEELMESVGSIPENLERCMAAGFGNARDARPSVIERLQAQNGLQLGVHLMPPTLEVEGPLVTVESREGTGEQLKAGRYQIHGEIARGGVGIVYHGRDGDLGRDVALKVLRPEHAACAEIVARFVEEAQIGGQLQHPGIVPVYEMGLQHDQRPFFAMKLVKGDTLSALLKGRSTPQEDRRRFLGIFEQICQTVAYAHARQVVHRDLKPSNVMVGAFGEVQVVDWGLAKILKRGAVEGGREHNTAAHSVSVIASSRSRAGKESLTGSVMGTPAYMPPEQATGDVEALNARSDVFSLGAILCEILTGSPPYVGSRDECLRMAATCATETALNDLRGRGLDPELVSLVEDCLQAEPSLRPRDVQALVRRVSAYLAALESRAHAAELRSARAQVRTRWVAGVAAAAVLLTLGGTWGYSVREKLREERMQTAGVAAGAALDEARTFAGMARALLANDNASALGMGRYYEAVAAAEKAEVHSEAADSAMREEVFRYLAELTSTSERAQQTAVRLDRDRSLAEALLQAKIPRDDNLFGEDADLLRAEHLDTAYSSALMLHGIVLDDLTVDQAVAELQGTVNTRIAAAMVDWGRQRQLLEKEGRPTGGSWAHPLAVARSLDVDDPWRRELHEELAKRELDEEGLSRLWSKAESESVVPIAYLVLGDAMWEIGSREKAIDVLEAGQLRHPGDFLLSFWLGARHEAMYDETSSLRWYAAARAIRPTFTETLHRIGVVGSPSFEMSSTGFDRRTEPARDAFEELVRNDPENGHWHRHLAVLHSWDSNIDDAIREMRLAIRPGDEDAWACHLLGKYLINSGEVHEALKWMEKAVQLDPKSATIRTASGLVLGASGDVEGAIAEYRKVNSSKPGYVQAFHLLGVTLVDMGSPQAAVAVLQEAIELVTQEKRPVDYDFAATYQSLGNAFSELGRIPEAQQAYEAGIALKPRVSRAAALAHNLGHLLLKQEMFAEAVVQLHRAAELDPDRDISSLQSEWHTIGLLLQDLDRPQEALAAFARLVELDPADPDPYVHIGSTLVGLEQWDESLEAYEKVIELAGQSKDRVMALINQAKVWHRKGNAEKATDCSLAAEYEAELAGLESNAEVIQELRRLRESLAFEDEK